MQGGRRSQVWGRGRRWSEEKEVRIKRKGKLGSHVNSGLGVSERQARHVGYSIGNVAIDQPKQADCHLRNKDLMCELQ